MRWFQRLSRSVAVLLVVTGVIGAVTGIAMIVSFTATAGVAPWFEVRAPVWAAWAAASTVVSIIVPSVVLAAIGVRWWQTPFVFGRGRRRELYALFALLVLAAVFAAIAGVAVAVFAAVAGALLVVATLGAAVVARADETDAARRRTHWGRLAAATAAAVAVASGSAATGAALIADDLGPGVGVYPSEAVVCDGPVDESCARRAATRAGRTVAWLPDVGDRKSASFVVFHGKHRTTPVAAGRVFQELSDGWVYVTVYTEPAGPRTGRRNFLEQIDVGGGTADLYIDEDQTPSASIEWTRDGTRYEISAHRSNDDLDSVVRVARRALRDVRYASP